MTKEKKIEHLHMRMTKQEKELLENIANSLHIGEKNVSLSRAIIECMTWVKRIMIKNNTYRPINKELKNEIKQIDAEIELCKKFNLNKEELVEIMNYNWLEDEVQ